MKRARWGCSDARRALLLLIAWVAGLIGVAASAIAAAEPIAATYAAGRTRVTLRLPPRRQH